MKAWISLIFSALFMVSCASTHHQNKALPVTVPEGIDLVISSKLNKSYSDGSHLYYDFTFENKGSHWLRLDEIEIEFLSNDGIPHNIIVGQDLVAWAESYKIRKQKENLNSDLGTAALILGGAVLMVAAASSGNGGHSSGARGAGALLYGSGIGFGATKELMSNRDRVMNAKQVPETHLLAPVTIPSNGYSQRWILLNLPQRRIANQARLKFRTVEGQTVSYDVALIEEKGGKL